MLIVALLHDTIEDTTTDFDDIAERHGPEIAHWVACLTKNKALPELAREADYLLRLQSAPWQVQACKLADVFDNLIDSVNMPAERRARGLERGRSYLDALKARNCTRIAKASRTGPATPGRVAKLAAHRRPRTKTSALAMARPVPIQYIVPGIGLLVQGLTCQGGRSGFDRVS